LITAARANFKNTVFRLWIEGLRHQTHDRRRRDRLAFTDGQRLVIVSECAVSTRNEFVPRDASHDLQNLPISDSVGGNFFLYHASTLYSEWFGRVKVDQEGEADKDEA
jgi:hypothetical protein